MKTITIDLPDYLMNKLREKAEAANLSLNDYIVRCLFTIAYEEPGAKAAKAMMEAKNVESGVEDTSSVEPD